LNIFFGHFQKPLVKGGPISEEKLNEEKLKQAHKKTSKWQIMNKYLLPFLKTPKSPNFKRRKKINVHQTMEIINKKT